jgi:phosphoribosylaminoimidazolecarboxamide formyltransferase/IMP cyclohydrolase
VSVSDKTGIEELAKGLTKAGYEIISTGGTAAALNKAGVKTLNISDVTGFPECLDGRVKTLHPAVHAGLLAMRGNPDHMKTLAGLNINTIDVVVVNLYPFKQTIAKPEVDFAEAVENIDIGGPTMLRSAAKNYSDVLVLVDPADYAEALRRLENGAADTEFRKYLMYKVFAHTAVYDSLISNFLREKLSIRYPDTITFAYEKKQSLRYGENPHQSGAFYGDAAAKSYSLASAEQLGGKELSYNNINDASGALDLLREFSAPAAVAVKHSNPCGAAVADNVYDAYLKAYECDPVSIYGGIVALNRTVDKRTADELVKIFLEIVIAPDFTAEATEVLKTKPNMRVLKLAGPPQTPFAPSGEYDMKKLYGGVLLQDRDYALFDPAALKTVTKTAPTPDDIKQLEFAYRVVKHTKSNGIAIAKDFAAVGIGGGQTNRIWAAKQALEHAGDRAKGAYLASDAYFPFSDCVEAAAAAGIKAIIQPGGSIRDGDSIAACDKYGIAMVFVGMRHFKH